MEKNLFTTLDIYWYWEYNDVHLTSECTYHYLNIEHKTPKINVARQDMV